MATGGWAIITLDQGVWMGTGRGQALLSAPPHLTQVCGLILNCLNMSAQEVIAWQGPTL